MPHQPGNAPPPARITRQHHEKKIVEVSRWARRLSWLEFTRVSAAHEGPTPRDLHFLELGTNCGIVAPKKCLVPRPNRIAPANGLFARRHEQRIRGIKCKHTVEIARVVRCNNRGG